MENRDWREYEDVDEDSGDGIRKFIIAAAGIVCGLAVSMGIAYAYLARQYKSVFFPNTIVNGRDVSGKTVDQAKELIDSDAENYVLTVVGRDGNEERIPGQEIGLHTEYDGTMEKLIAEQKPLLWGIHLVREIEYTINTMSAYDEEKLDAAVNGLECMDTTRTKAPENAYISEYQQGAGYQIIAEKPGTRVIPDKAATGIREAVLRLDGSVSLEELGAYEEPQVTADDPELTARVERLNQYAGMVVTYHFGDQTEILDGDTIHTWLSDDGQGNMLVDETKVKEYVDGLAAAYDTAYRPKTLQTAYGDTVTITGGNYGWQINRGEETAALADIIRSGVSQEREPVYLQTAASRGEKEYGDTYVEINLTAQHLYFYKDGALMVESDFVSGNESRGWGTPAGAYPLAYKQRNATLKGEGYATPVSYWMPFNRGIGLHDAGWRGSFGGAIYKTNGSHGCINLPKTVAKTIYENISAGVPVLCYHLDVPGNKKADSGQKNMSVAGNAGAAAGAQAVPAGAQQAAAGDQQAASAGAQQAAAGDQQAASAGAQQAVSAGAQQAVPAGAQQAVAGTGIPETAAPAGSSGAGGQGAPVPGAPASGHAGGTEAAKGADTSGGPGAVVNGPGSADTSVSGGTPSPGVSAGVVIQQDVQGEVVSGPGM